MVAATVDEALIEPASTSGCVVVYVDVQLVDAPGASVVAWHDGVDAPESDWETARLESVVAPVLVTVWVNVRPFTAAVKPVGEDVVETLIEEVGSAVTATTFEATDRNDEPLCMPPAVADPDNTRRVSTSDCVVVYDDVHVVDAPAAERRRLARRRGCTRERISDRESRSPSPSWCW